MEYVLTTEHLQKKYRHFKALDDVTMHVPKGAIYGFVGRNGAGKTTLIRLVCGLQKATGGEYTLYGTGSKEKGIERARRRVGAVVETPSVYQHMTAEENLRHQYQIIGLPSEEGIGELLALVGLSDTGKKKAGDFSMGMRQRLGIAVALAGNPDFLLLDEPSNGLDPQGIVEMRELILKLNREYQITVLISSHILGELSRLATHYGFIDRGQMVREISAKELEVSGPKCIHVEGANIQALAKVLDGRGIRYSILSETAADIYGQMEVTELTLALAAEGCKIKTLHEKDESLEGYFISLVGGESHA